MKLFATVRVYFGIMGIRSSSQQPRKYSFNSVSLAILATLVYFSVATTAFILYDAESFKQFADSFYSTATAIATTLNFIAIICNSSIFFELIESFENAIETSKKEELFGKF